jgi:hypothetical protein
LPVAAHPYELMGENLPTGVRRVPSAAAGAPQATVPASVTTTPSSVQADVGTLPAGKRVVVYFDVLIANPVPKNVTSVSNQASVSGSNFATLRTDDPATAATTDPTITQLDIVTTVRIYLPIVQRDVDLPDLVVDQIVVTRTSIQVVIRNQGAGAVTNPFWVDVYINPNPAPTQVNQTWPMLGSRGLVWGVQGSALPLNPGGTLTLSIGGAYYRADLSNFSGTLAAGTPIYAQVDSANANVAYGAVLETHEQFGGPYNNISGPVAPTSAMRLGSAASTAEGPRDDAGMPARPMESR